MSLTKNCVLWILCYAVTLGLALYLKQPSDLLHSSQALVLSLSLGGLILAGIFSLLFKKNSLENRNWKSGVLFFLIQGSLSWAIAQYVFNADWMLSILFAVGSLIGIVLWISEPYQGWNRLLSVILLVVGFVLSLRLGKIWGGLLYTLAILNSGILSWKMNEEFKNYWHGILFSITLLATGRALLQYYLLAGNVPFISISPAYSFAALFLGLLIPLLDDHTQRQKLLNPYLSIFVLGILAPLAVGIFLHVRPGAAYMLGILTSAFAVAIFQQKSARMLLLSLLNLGSLSVALPLLTKANGWTRLDRLWILIGLFVLGALLLWINCKMIKKDEGSSVSI